MVIFSQASRMATAMATMAAVFSVPGLRPRSWPPPNTLEAMEREGTRKITRINPEPDGILDPEKVAAEADGTTNLVSVMAANNEIGALQPIAEISRAIKKSSRSLMVFHTDAMITTASPSTPSKRQLIFPGRRLFMLPLIWAPGISRIRSTSLSRSRDTPAYCGNFQSNQKEQPQPYGFSYGRGAGGGPRSCGRSENGG